MSIAVGRNLALPGSSIARIPNSHDPDNLWNAGLWFPASPPTFLHFNQHSFPQGLHYAERFRPLIWTHFGGPNGIYLRNLVALRFHFSEELYGIDFKYNNPYVPNSCHSLGRYQCSGSTCYAHHDFDIDGPGGELVASIDVLLVTFDGNDDNIGQNTYVLGLMVRCQLQIHVLVLKWLANVLYLISDRSEQTEAVPSD